MPRCGSVEPQRFQGGELGGGVHENGHALVEPGGLGCLQKRYTITSAGGNDHRIGLGRQDGGDIGRKIGLAHFPPRLTQQLHVRAQLLQTLPNAVGHGMAVLVIVTGDPVLFKWPLGQPRSAGLADQSGVFGDGKNIAVAFGSCDLGAF